MPEGNKSRVSGVGVEFVFTSNRAMGKASPWLLTDMLTKKHNPLRCTPSVGQVWGGIK